MLDQLKRIIPNFLQKHLVHLRSVLLTEYNFHFRRQEIHEHLNKVRALPLQLHIEGTNICNAKCAFCAYPQMERAKETMPLDIFRRVVDEYVSMGGRFVSLTPIVGDPFVDPLIFERLDYLNEYPEIEGFYLFTNAILMKPNVSERLLKYGKKLNLSVSWGGFDKDTYKKIMGVNCFERVCSNIESFIEAKKRTNSPLNLTIGVRCPREMCKGEMWDKLCIYENEGLLNLDGHQIQYDSWAGKIKPEILREIGLQPARMPYKKGACHLLYAKPVILANGKVNACACRDVETELIIGDIHESSLNDIWTSQALDNIIESHENNDFPDVCKRCTFYTSVYRPTRALVFKEELPHSVKAHWTKN